MLPDDAAPIQNNAPATVNPGYEYIAGQGFHTDKSRINTAGRVKGSKNRATVLKEIMALVIDGKGLDGAEAKMTVETAVMQALVKKAMEGDVPAIKEAQDTVYGKLTDKQELTGANGEPLAAIVRTVVDPKKDVAS